MGLLDFPLEVAKVGRLKETAAGYIVRLNIPGLEEKDIKTTIRQDRYGNSLEIKASKDHHREIKDDKKGFYLKENGYAEFRRIFGLGKDILANKTKTKYENGIFEIIIPKRIEK